MPRLVKCWDHKLISDDKCHCSLIASALPSHKWSVSYLNVCRLHYRYLLGPANLLHFLGTV